MEKIAKFILFLTVACLSVGLLGCSTDYDNGSSNQKIISLKVAIDKAVTIANGDLGNAVLTVSADDVTLSNVTGSATVNTSIVYNIKHKYIF